MKYMELEWEIGLFAALALFVAIFITRWRIRQSGKVLCEIGRRQHPIAPILAPGVLCCTPFVFWLSEGGLEKAGLARLIDLLGPFIPLFSIFIYLLFISTIRNSIREGGILNNGWLLPWHKIESVEWLDVKPSHWTLFVSIRGWWPRHRTVWFKIPIDKKAGADEALRKLAWEKIKN